MQNSVINFTTEQKTKKEAQKLARKMGVSLSTILNHYLREFVKEKTITFNAEDEILTEWAKKELAESERDVAEGRVTSFDSIDEAIAYLDKIIAKKKKAASKNGNIKSAH